MSRRMGLTLAFFLAAMQQTTLAAPSPRASRLPALRANGSARLPAAVEKTLANGMGVEVLEDGAAALVDIKLIFRFGLEEGGATPAAAAHLAAHLLREDDEASNRAQAGQALALMGTALDVQAAAGAVVLSLRVLPANLGAALKLLADLVAPPQLSQARLASMKQAEIAAIKAHGRLDGLAQVLAMGLLFPGLSYGVVESTPAAFSDLEPKEVIRYWEEHYRPEKAVLILHGPVGVAEALERAQPLGAWRPRAAAPTRPAVAMAPAEPQPASLRAPLLIFHGITPPAMKAVVLAAWRLPARNDARTPAFALLGEILGQKAKRLGLTVYVDGYFQASVMVAEEKSAREQAGDALKALLGQVGRLAKGEITQVELDAARRRLEAGYLMTLARPGGLTQLEAMRQIERLSPDTWATFQKRLAQVQLQDVRAAGRELVAEQAAIVVVGDEAITPQLEPIGRVVTSKAYFY